MRTNHTYLTSIIAMILLLGSQNVKAQWITVTAPVQESDISQVTKQAYQNYKGLTSATFEIVCAVEAVKEKGIVKFKLNTQSVNMVNYGRYSYRPAPKLKSCINNKVVENETNNYFSAKEIGEDYFKQAMRTANATFDVEITFIVKDSKYGMAGNGHEKGWGYRATRTFKNVKANGVFWAEEPIETKSSIEEIKILSNPKLVSFQINDSNLKTALLDYVKKRNQIAEDECKGKTNNEDKVKDEADKKVKERAKEMEELKIKLQNQKSETLNNSTKEDGFWRGEKMQNTTHNGNSDVQTINKDGRIYLKDSYDIIKEWDGKNYSKISLLKGSHDWFVLYLKPQGANLLSQNYEIIVDRKGNTVKMDGEETFYSIFLREDGGYTLLKYMSESMYNVKSESSWTPNESYASSSEAITDLKTNINRLEAAERRRRQNHASNTVYFTSYQYYNVVQVKEIITNAKMQVLLSKTYYIVKK